MPNGDTQGDIPEQDDLSSYFLEAETCVSAVDPDFKPRPYQPIPREWLGSRCEIPAALEKPPEPPLRDSPEALADPAAWNRAQGRWTLYQIQEGWRTEISDQMRPDDELWDYSSPRDTWMHFAGTGGYAIVRNGKIVRHFRMWMN